DELQTARSDLDDVRYRLDTQRESIQALESDREDVTADVEELPDTTAGDTTELDAEIERLRDHKRSLESTISQLQRVLQFNEEMLDGDNPELQSALGDTDRATASEDNSELTDQLLADEDTTVCWTCGSEVERTAIDNTLDSLRSLREAKSHERNEIATELDELTDTRSRREADRDRRERLDRKLDDIDREIADRKDTIDDLTDERERLETEIEAHETAVDDLESQDHSELLDLHKEANQLEFELGRLETDREEIAEEIESVEKDVKKRDRLETERADLQEELADLRTRIEPSQAEAVEAFNEHMETILGVLAYENIERIWIERTQREVQEGRRTVERTAFDLHVVRRAESGTTYEDTVDHLSESEREVTGLVFALA